MKYTVPHSGNCKFTLSYPGDEPPDRAWQIFRTFVRFMESTAGKRNVQPCEKHPTSARYGNGQCEACARAYSKARRLATV